MSNPIDNINVCIPVVSGIVERIRNWEKEVLIQTRWKPERDPEYSWTIEIPAWWINRYENVYDAIKREILEETWLEVIKITPDIKSNYYSPKNDLNFAFIPFCCQQQLKWWKPWVWFVFICEVEDTQPIPQEWETKDIRWINIKELKRMFDNEKEKIFTLQLWVLEFYLKHNNL